MGNAKSTHLLTSFIGVWPQRKLLKLNIPHPSGFPNKVLFRSNNEFLKLMKKSLKGGRKNASKHAELGLNEFSRHKYLRSLENKARQFGVDAY